MEQRVCFSAPNRFVRSKMLCLDLCGKQKLKVTRPSSNIKIVLITPQKKSNSWKFAALVTPKLTKYNTLTKWWHVQGTMSTIRSSNRIKGNTHFFWCLGSGGWSVLWWWIYYQQTGNWWYSAVICSVIETTTILRLLLLLTNVYVYVDDDDDDDDDNEIHVCVRACATEKGGQGNE